MLSDRLRYATKTCIYADVYETYFIGNHQIPCKYHAVADIHTFIYRTPIIYFSHLQLDLTEVLLQNHGSKFHVNN
jgi:hypothetical protein